MIKLTKLALIGSLFTVLASQVVAQGNWPSEPIEPPKAICEGDRCRFENLQLFGNGGRAAYFYCTPPDGIAKFKMENRSSLVTGFDSQGELVIDDNAKESAKEFLGKYSFGAYTDPQRGNAAYVIHKAWDVNGNVIPMTCHSGRGDPFRSVYMPDNPRF